VTELAVTSASAALAFLVLYGAAVMFTLERIADRFGSALLPGFLRRGVVLRFVALAVLVLVGLVVIALPDSPMKIIASFSVFIVGLLLVALASYWTWRDGSDVLRMLKLAQSATDPAQAVREILWRALERADVVTVGLSLRTFERRSPARADLLTWLLGHRVLQDRDWLTTEILAAELEGGLDEAAAEAVREPLMAILDGALRREQFDLVYRVTHETMEALRLADPFTTDHAQLVTDVGRKIWLIGDYRGTAPRKASLPEQLEYVKMIYTIRRRDIWFALLRRKYTEEVDAFVHFLCLFADDTRDNYNVYSLYTDILMDGGRAGILSVDALRDLANSMRWMRLHELAEASGEGAPDEELSPLEPPGESMNSQFLILVAAALVTGASDDDIAELASTYGIYGDRDFIRRARRHEGVWGYDQAKAALERILGR